MARYFASRKGRTNYLSHNVENGKEEGSSHDGLLQGDTGTNMIDLGKTELDHDAVRVRKDGTGGSRRREFNASLLQLFTRRFHVIDEKGNMLDARFLTPQCGAFNRPGWIRETEKL